MMAGLGWLLVLVAGAAAQEGRIVTSGRTNQQPFLVQGGPTSGDLRNLQVTTGARVLGGLAMDTSWTFYYLRLGERLEFPTNNALKVLRN